MNQFQWNEPAESSIGFHSAQVFKNQLLGVGHYGTIYKAKCDGLLCAAKIFHASCFQSSAGVVTDHHGSSDTDNSAAAVKAFKQKYQFLSAVRHPNIVLYFGFQDVPNIDLPVLFMELMDESLTNFLESSALPLSRGIQLNFCHDISLALSYLHLNNIVHGNLSSNNILLLSNIRAKLIDFGMATLRSTQAPQNAVYLPPEFEGTDPDQFTSSVDCFSFGVLVIQILTRKIPKPAKKQRQVASKPNLDSQVPEVERRRSHIEEIPSNHPLLPVALTCLNDEAGARPSALELASRIEQVKSDISLSSVRCPSPIREEDVQLKDSPGSDTADVKVTKEHEKESILLSEKPTGSSVEYLSRSKQGFPRQRLTFSGVSEKGKAYRTTNRKKTSASTPVDCLEDYAHNKFSESESEVVTTSYARLKRQFSSRYFDSRKLLLESQHHTKKEMTTQVYQKCIETLAQHKPTTGHSYHQHTPKANSSLIDQMQRNVSAFSHHISLLQQAFDVSLEDHEVILNDVMRKIVHRSENFSSEIQVKVIEAQGLLQLKRGYTSHESNVRVTVAIGNTSMSTGSVVQRAEEKKPLSWNEELTGFLCYDYYDVIHVKVWRDKNGIKGRSWKPNDCALVGEVNIDIRDLVGTAPRQVWYKLVNTMSKGQEELNGHIKLSVSVTVDGDSEKSQQLSVVKLYKKLHEQLFYHCHVGTQEPLSTFSNNKTSQPNPPVADQCKEVCSMLLPPIAQEIANIFARKFAVLPVTELIIHLELLVDNHSLTNAITTIENMLKILKLQISQATGNTGTRASMMKYMEECDISYENFRSILKKLLSLLEADLQHYREICPIEDPRNLVNTCQLMESVLDFQQQVMNIMYPETLESRIYENMKEGVRQLFCFVVDDAQPEGHSGNVHPAQNTTGKPFEFFIHLIQQLVKIIGEDRAFYGPIIAKFCRTLNLGDMSAEELWHQFYESLESFFSNEENLDLFPPDEYIKLFFYVKNFYNSHVKKVRAFSGVIPKFPRLFLPSVKRWMKLSHERGMRYIDNAWKDDNFEPYEGLKFTTSVFDMLCYLQGELKFIKALELEDKLVHMDQFEEFAKVIKTIVQHYVDKVATHVPQYIGINGDLKTACMLLNNLQKLRTGVQDLFTAMGGKGVAGPGALEVLNGVQSNTLSEQLPKWCAFVGKSLTSSVEKAVRSLQDELMKLKGNDHVTKEEVITVAKPLMDTLKEKALIIHCTCESVVAQKVMKEVWYVCLDALRIMLFPMIKLELKDEGTAQPSCIDYPVHNYTSKQCSAFKEFVIILKKTFQQSEESAGLKLKDTLERGTKQLTDAISLYEQRSELLIKDFIHEETSCLKNTDIAVQCGKLYIELSTQTQLLSGELQGRIRIIAAEDLKGDNPSATLKPYIELTSINPFTLVDRRWKVVTTAKTGNSPKFDDSFEFILSHWEYCELQVVAKHRVTFGKDRTIGVAVIPLASITKNPSMTVGLSNSLTLSHRCQAIINVLCARRDCNDFTAKEFLELKHYLL